ncbi:MAG: hypothetical protein V2J13_10860 [Cycloclasticus sp.]|jgi:hypothetical protein|nr:hypothetical protein [Cycloclasticus sp.]
MFDYVAFEQRLENIIVDIGYPLDNVVRWETTGQAKISRAGRIQHYWDPHNPGAYRFSAKGRRGEHTFFLSNGLYFDTNQTMDAFDVYETMRVMLEQSRNSNRQPVAIIAGTFELSPKSWYDRNVLGKLLAVSMGASTNKNEYSWSKLLSAMMGTSNEMGDRSIDFDKRRSTVLNDWKTKCEDWIGKGSPMCANEGQGMISFQEYYNKWLAQWSVFKKDISERYASAFP